MVGGVLMRQNFIECMMKSSESFRKHMTESGGFNYLNCVTPQMFGAIGDGLTDDTKAIQDAINSGQNVVFPQGTYYITSEVLFFSKHHYVFDASRAIFRSDAPQYTFHIRNCSYCNFDFGTIHATKSTAIAIRNTQNTNEYCQYLNIEFDYINALIGFDVCATCGWLNEIRVAKGRLNCSQYGIVINHTSEGNIINRWSFEKIGFEGTALAIGCYMVATQGSIRSMYFHDCRYGECDNVLTTLGEVREIMFVSDNQLYSRKVSFSDKTSGIFYCPILTTSGVTQSNEMIVENGVCVPVRADIYSNMTHGNPVDFNSQYNTDKFIGNSIYFIVVATTGSVKLSPRYGRSRWGVNEFIVSFGFDNGTNFEILDYQGNVIFNDTSNCGWKKYMFKWLNGVWVAYPLTDAKEGQQLVKE